MSVQLHAASLSSSAEFLSESPVPSARRRSVWLQLALTCVILTLGALEGWYGRTDFSTDAISYLDISRAIPAGDWKMVFNPLWSVGYPALLAAARPLFAATPDGEWLSIRVVSFGLFVVAWLSFLYLLRSARYYLEDFDSEVADSRYRLLFLAGSCIFIGIEICIDTVSRVGPDILVSIFFFLGTGTLLRLLRSRDKVSALKLAAVLGSILGAGYWCKGIFLPLACVLLLVSAGGLLWKKRSPVPALLSLAIFAVVIAPYVAGLSWSYGHFTLGESGKLNYAFHVNYLPRWTNWQGGPAGYGMPIHPTHQLMKDPNLYVFGEPYHNTYPPFGNVVYWYEGYRQFWSPKFQAIGIARNLWYLLQILITQPIFYALAVSVVLLLTTGSIRRAWLKGLRKLWTFYLPALLGVALYVQVHLEARYLGSFLAILCLVPFVAVIGLSNRLPRNLQTALMVAMAAGAVLNVAVVDRQVFANIWNGYTYRKNPQWILAVELKKLGVAPGSKVAVVGGPNASCTWAYLDHLRIVAEMGGEPYNQLMGPEVGAGKEVEIFWHATPEERATILDHFRQADAVAVIASQKPADVELQKGWHHLDGTETWVYRFEESN